MDCTCQVPLSMEFSRQEFKHNNCLLPPAMENNISPNDKTFDYVDVRTVCFYLHKRRLLWVSRQVPQLGCLHQLGFILQQTVNARQGPLKGSQLGVPRFRQIPSRRWQGLSKLSALVLSGKGKDIYNEASWKSHEEIWGLTI